MPSLLRSYSLEKQTGTVYTPDALVEAVLDAIGYHPGRYPEQAEARILDPACGDGQFLVGVAQRILHELPPSQWTKALSAIEGWDIDATALQKAQDRLNTLIAPHGLSIPWRLYRRDSLQAYPDLFSPRGEYDFILGNPPYIRIQHLPDAYKRFLQSTFRFCQSGSTDVYLAFFELGIALLAPTGKLAFLSPNSWLYTAAARTFRETLRQERLLEKVIDFDAETPFPGVGAYITITVLSRQPHAFWVYQRLGDKPLWMELPVDRFPAEVWHSQTPSTRTVPLGEIAHIGVGLTTLADRIFILRGAPDSLAACPTTTLRTASGECLQIETDLLRPIIKASTFRGDAGHPREYIIFPYRLENGNFRILPEEELQLRFPLGYAYLRRHKEILLRRDGGKPNPEGWYAFGRHQNLEASFGVKIIFPPISDRPRFVLSKLADCTIYSGYFIKYDGDYEKLLSQLNSARMEEYIRLHSRPFRGGWRAFSKRVIERFPVFL